MLKDKELEDFKRAMTPSIWTSILLILLGLFKLLLALLLNGIIGFIVGALITAPFLWLFGSDHVRDNAMILGVIIGVVLMLINFVMFTQRVSQGMKDQRQKL